jgi:hypothetical protein
MLLTNNKNWRVTDESRIGRWHELAEIANALSDAEEMVTKTVVERCAT